MKKKVTYFIIAIVVVGLLFLFRRTVNSYDDSVCSGFQISYIPANADTIIDVGQLNELVKQEYQQIEGVRMDEIDMQKVNNILLSSPFVKDAKVFKDLNGTVHAEIEQRNPLLRVFGTQGKSFIVDEDGDIMPVPESFSSSIICVNGDIDFVPNGFYGCNVRNLGLSNLTDAKSLISLHVIGKALASDEHFSDLIAQIYINEDKSIELIPAIGDFIIFFGDAAGCQEKLRRLYILYTEILPYVDISIYKEVDITLENQFVFLKKV